MARLKLHLNVMLLIFEIDMPFHLLIFFFFLIPKGKNRPDVELHVTGDCLQWCRYSEGSAAFFLSFNFVNFQVLFYGKGVQETKARALARQLAQLNGAWVGGARAAEACGV